MAGVRLGSSIDPRPYPSRKQLLPGPAEWCSGEFVKPLAVSPIVKRIAFQKSVM